MPGNVMAGDTELGPIRCSDEFRWFLAGWIAHVAESMPFYAPSVNSYNRFSLRFLGPNPLGLEPR
jgi:glutamine synthetase